MQATSPTFRAITDTGGITTTILVLIALGALLTVVAILYGMRLARQRRAARRVEEARVEAEASDEPVSAPSAEPAAPPPSPEPTPALPAADPLPLAPDLADEPVVAAVPLDASPAAEAELEPAPEPAGPPPADRPLTLLKGLGPKVAARLEELGVASVGDLARLSPAEAEALDARLGPFTGRMARDRWLDQARLLAAGDDRAFEAEFGKL